MGTVILVVLFYLFLAFVSFVIVYANDTVDIANNDFEPYRPSISELPEVERTEYTIDYYIEHTMCPRYHYQILRNKINRYQQENRGAFLPFFMFNLILSVLPLKIVKTWNFFAYLVAFVLGCVCFFIVKRLYEKYSSVRMRSYCTYHPTYDWYSHYQHLLYAEDKVIFRYVIRKFITFFAVLCYIGFCGMELNLL